LTSHRVPERFQVLAELYADEAEVVLRARDAVLDREVVLKVPGPGLASAFRDRDVRQAGLAEARALARVRHAGVVRLFEVIEGPDGPVLVMEPLSGGTLAEHLAREGRLPAAEVLQLGLRLTDALAEVHAAGLVHRGISAHTVRIGHDGGATLTGFHFTKTAAPAEGGIPKSSILYAAGLERVDRALPAHPSPEQIIGQPADARSDLFSLGWVLFRCLTGEDPYENTAVFRGKAPRDPQTLAPDCPRALARAIVRCLAVDPAGRPESARALHATLAEIRPDVRASARPSARRNAVAMSVGVLALVGAWALFDRSGAKGDLSGGDASIRGVVRAEDPGPDAYSGEYGRSFAFLIGISAAYEGTGFPVLPNAERDVAALAKTLESADDDQWKVETLLGERATRAGVIDAMSSLADRTARDDRVFVYYAGHGEAHANSRESGWMIPADAEPEKRSTWVRFDEFFRFFDEAKAKHILVAMDCCYGGRLAGVRSGRTQNFARRFLTSRAHLVVASGRRDEQVSDGVPGEHSPFARAFLDALKDPDPLTSSMLFARIQESFTRWDVGHSPQFGYPEGSPAGGEFVFFK
jgi:hypothetical protein